VSGIPESWTSSSVFLLLFVFGAEPANTVLWSTSQTSTDRRAVGHVELVDDRSHPGESGGRPGRGRWQRARTVSLRMIGHTLRVRCHSASDIFRHGPLY